MKSIDQIYYEDINIGQIIGPKKILVDRKQLVMYAGASQDFNEFHYDDEVAKKAGHKGIIIHGALKSAWLAQFVIEFIGIEGKLNKFNVSYRGVDFPYEELKYYGEITKIYANESSGFAEVELALENAEGKKTTPASALIELPKKNK